MTGERGVAFASALVRLGHRRPWTVVLAMAAVVVIGILLAATLTFETDVLSLVPRHDPVVQGFKHVMEEFGSLDTLLVAVPVADEDGQETAFALIDALADELAKSPELSHVEAHLEDPVKLAETVLRHAVLYLDEDGLRQLETKLTNAGLQARAADIRSALDTPHGMLAKEFAVRDPLGFLPLLLGRVSRTPAALKVDFSSGYMLSADHSMVLLLAKPTGPAQNIDFDEKLFKDLGARIDRARQRVADEQEIELAAVPKVLLGGGHRTAVEDARLIKSDMLVNSVSSLLGVMALFYFAYRRLATAHYAFLPLAVGLAMAFGFAAVTLGKLSSATAGFGAMLVGLGIDFTIVMYGRYLEERQAGKGIDEALEVMASSSGPAVMLGAMTTVGTFFAFMATRFQGLREFGLLVGTGIVLMMISTFLLLPALVTLSDRGKPPAPHSRLFDVTPILLWAQRSRRWVLAVAAVLTAVALVAMPRVRFNDDVRNLRSASNRGVEIQEQVAKSFGLSFSAMMVRVEADSMPEAMERVRLLARGLDPLVARGTISSYESLVSLVPPVETQRRALAWAAAHRDLADPARVRTQFAAALEAQGLVPGAFEAGLAGLDETLRPRGPVSLEVWRGTPVQQLVDRSLHVTNGKAVTVVNVFSPPGKWRREAPPELVELVAAIPGATLTGINLVSERLRHIVWQDAALAGGVGLLVVLLMLLWEMRSVRAALTCLLPVALAIVWTFGVMVLFGLSLNLLNVFVMTMIIGVGVDYGIHVLHRIREGQSLQEIGETGRAVLLAALTTVVGFGSLVTTHYPGLRSIGWMTSLGVLFSCFAALVILPLVVRREP